jgi:glyoxylase-like metal-dependent hydrolase (beta-lactamase superfamily II)
MHYLVKWLIPLLLALTFGAPACAATLEVQKVTDNVYAIVGELGQRSPENLGNNATFGAIVTGEGVVLIDAGGSYKGAARIERALRTVTDKPVVLVINTGGQDHRWIGNGYWKERGARIVASKAAVEDQKARVSDELTALEMLIKPEGFAGTRDVYADETFDTELKITVGGTRLVIRHPGPAHTPGDSFVWLPEQRVVFTGDIVYVERLLGVMPMSKSKSWIKAFEAIAALDPEHVVPGHGHATTLARARADTYDYLVFLRGAVKALYDAGGGIDQIGTIDQSRFAHLKVFDQLSGRNASQVYQELEWE